MVYTYSTEQFGVEVAKEEHGDAVAPGKYAHYEHFRVLVLSEVVEGACRKETLWKHWIYT